ncbi:MAG: bifunctional adenosylcobinamide kinase/adenosylcobinamide-phosphate guanylyltransferase [Candidatus Binatus sp.]|uniref:bifunctional adenosylcobinamide kinase/adenosylcobinamide-phosphate guanylyltransferase n=1 Tax=Candidatus Binatus sp. TaxID=2811406 RepID=UPI002727A59B|nr:bifunctional adenosylcobinamide kinase/adenosylcobinamide-phosphate guanylyltransferase [Candidatus Binatus sp.]MDO8430873.1 bifunctional adenosylcobinamide kinase/adenosylcobinamide-phosphate guanylyltransferase [Candidatus Binatus sp.]
MYAHDSMARITLLTGGARSGKSTHALKLANSYRRKFFIATGEALDEEMTARIAFHRETRPPDFQTIEEPANVARSIEAIEGRADVVVIDCLTLWISNLMHTHNDDEPLLAEADALAAALARASFASIVVTDEVGMGIVPMHPMERRYRDLLGWTNQKIAGIADEVLLMVAGYPIRVK